MRRVALMLAVLALSAAVAAGGTPTNWRNFTRDGISVRYPPRWHATAAWLTPVTAPSQILAIASYPLPRGSSGADGCQPKEALDRLPPGGAFIFGWDYGDLRLPGLRARDFPPRPKRFTLTGFAPYECLGPSYMLRFRERGRFIQIHVALGRGSTAETRRTVLRVLDSLRVARR